MLQFTATILRFKEQGEKTGWTYIEVPALLARELMPGNKKGFRVKGFLNDFPFSNISLLPMGGGNFILTLNASIRKGLKKSLGSKITVRMVVDTKPTLPPKELMECLEDEPKAMERFHQLPKSHQNYFTKWINDAKTEPTKARRMASSINALAKGLGFSEAVRALRKDQILE